MPLESQALGVFPTLAPLILSASVLRTYSCAQVKEEEREVQGAEEFVGEGLSEKINPGLRT